MLLCCAARGGMLATPPKSPESTAACIPQHTRHTPAKAALVGSHCIPPSRALCQQAHPAPNEPPQPRHQKELHPSPAWLPCPSTSSPAPLGQGPVRSVPNPSGGCPRKQRQGTATATRLRAAGCQQAGRQAEVQQARSYLLAGQQAQRRLPGQDQASEAPKQLCRARAGRKNQYQCVQQPGLGSRRRHRDRRSVQNLEATTKDSSPAPHI